jgi:hypothetical protein
MRRRRFGKEMAGGGRAEWAPEGNPASWSMSEVEGLLRRGAGRALARKLVVLVWHMLKNKEPYRYAQTRHTRAKLRRVTAGARPAKVGCVPRSLEDVYAEAGLPELRERTAGEKRATANSRRTVTRHRKQRGKRMAGA